MLVIFLCPIILFLVSSYVALFLECRSHNVGFLSSFCSWVSGGFVSFKGLFSSDLVVVTLILLACIFFDLLQLFVFMLFWAGAHYSCFSKGS